VIFRSEKMETNLSLIISIAAFLIALILKKYEYKYKFFKDLFHFFLAIGFIKLFNVFF